MKPTKHEFTGLSLADVSALTIPATCDLFANRVKTASKAFLDQGKLVHHLRNSKLKPGQTVYGLLQAKGVSEGSIQSAVTVADLIDALVIPGHLAEARFDDVITFRTSRQGRRLIQGKAAVTLEPQALAALMLSGTTAAVGAELDCLCEHGVTIAERETNLAAQATQAEADRKAASALAEIQKAEAEQKAKDDAAAAKAKAEADAAPANVTPIAPPVTPVNPVNPVTEPEDEEEEEDAIDAPDPADEEQEEPAADEPEEEEPEDDAPAPFVVDATRDRGTPPPAPPAGPTLASITSELNDTLIKAFDLPAEDLERLVHFLRAATNDIAATLDSLKAVA